MINKNQKIKILFFIDVLSGGGAAKVLLNLVNSMDQKQFQITVQSLYPEERAKELKTGIAYKYCYPKASRVNRLRMRLEAALRIAYSLHIKEKYDIEIAYLEGGPTKIMAGSTNRDALKLAWVHCDLNKKMADPAAFIQKTKRIYEKFDQVICVSEDVRRSFMRMYDSLPEPLTVYNCYNDIEILNRSEMPLPTEIEHRRVTAIAVGRLWAQKGYDRLLRVYKRLRDEGVFFDLWILGEGPERAALEQFITDNDLSETVRLLGFHENPYPFIRTADVMICSSHYEGFNTAAVEGLILGVPVVTTDCTGMKEIFGESEYGLITDNNEEALYQGLKKMLNRPGLLEHYTERAKIRGMSFRQGKLVQETEKQLFKLYEAKHSKSNRIG